jgi:hypothetical protein
LRVAKRHIAYLAAGSATYFVLLNSAREAEIKPDRVLNAKGDVRVARTARIRVSMRGTGAEQLVVEWKAL